MQTFLPYPDFKRSASCLDNKRLNKQRVETLQILQALHNPDYGWQHHPAVKMWRGSTGYLTTYGLTICKEWISRGYQDTCYGKILRFALSLPEDPDGDNYPFWLGDPDFHDSHKAALLFKDPEWYGRFGWNVEPKIEYVWPSNNNRRKEK